MIAVFGTEIDFHPARELTPHLRFFGELCINMMEKKRINELKTHYQERAAAVLEAMPDLIFVVDKNGSVMEQYHNSFENIGGKTWPTDVTDELMNQNKIDLKSIITAVISEDIRECLDIAIDSEGKKLYCEVVAVRLNEKEALIVVRDVTDRIESHNAVQASLNEKSILLKEIHHRVKNNLQIISSLINLGQSKCDPDNTADFIQQTKMRINSMALLHEKLYQSPDLSKINMKEYITKLVYNLLGVYGSAAGNVEVEYDLDPVLCTIETALPCSLIVNELIINALKYAFKERSDNRLLIGFRDEGEIYRIRIEDNGKGLSDDYDIRCAKSLGFEMVNVLTQQIKGTLRVVNIDGLKIDIEFPSQV